MSEVGKTHHIEVKGTVPPHIFKYLKQELGDDVIFIAEEDYGEELVDIEDTDWYKKMSVSMTPGDSVLVYRENYGLNQTQLGKKLGNFSKQYISDIENSRRKISKDMAKNLAKFFRVPIDRFI